eukprot:gnl/Spiro4/16448_TR8842_c0_g1_i1.p1 gnl/Spiro4/16448_TR8842_c0_g1~~gnl/Spiro4/16448_TR8842_c0_g1_i1.p1  ORF type:complete len:322 (-),score=99.42 gnl/Spiro4/16448_TR8842_c0_g1_i1:155-1120(-)
MTALRVFVLLLVCVGLAASQTTKKCRALALEGGGDKGAYEAGVIWGLVNNLPAEEVVWDVVTGISAGSINSVGVGVFKKGDEKNMADFVRYTAGNITASKVYRDWFPGGDLQGLFFETGLYNTQPLLNLIQSVLKENGGLKDRLITVGATSLTTGHLTLFNETTPDFATAVHASAAIPGVFQAVSYMGDTFSDGGVKMGVNVVSAVERCLTIVSDPKDIIVDIILCSGDKVKPVNPSTDHTMTVLLRNIAIMKYDDAMRQCSFTKMAYPTVNWRYLIWPTQTLPGLTDLDFNPQDIATMIQYGIQDAVAAIANSTATHRRA